MDSERDRREEELRRESARSRSAYDPSAEPPRVRRTSEPRVERLSEEDTRRADRRGTREALHEKEQEESGGVGDSGRRIDRSRILGAATAELVVHFIMLLGGPAGPGGGTRAR